MANKPLSPLAEALKAFAEQHNVNLTKLESAHRELVRNCAHEFEPLTPRQIADEWMSESSRCIHCNTRFGWRCKKSPDGVCHYNSSPNRDGEGRIIYLIDNSRVPVPDGHDHNHESHDWCIYCGMPEERK